MKFGIIGAMDDEIGLMQNRLEDPEIKVIGGMEFFQGQWQDKQVVLVRSGICKVNAALCTQTLITQFDVDAVIFTGVAGALDPSLDVGDIVISSDAIQHDVDATAFGYAPGQIPGLELAFSADENLVSKARRAAANALGDNKVIVGRVLSGDIFLADPDKARELEHKFQGACVEMEGAATAQTCHRYGIPFVIIRSISDRADGSANIDFKQFVKQSAFNAMSIVENILEEI